MRSTGPRAARPSCGRSDARDPLLLLEHGEPQAWAAFRRDIAVARPTRPAPTTATSSSSLMQPIVARAVVRRRLQRASRVPATRGRENLVGVQVAAGDEPRDDRVRVPHLPGAQLVAPPDWRARRAPGRAGDEQCPRRSSAGVGSRPPRRDRGSHLRASSAPRSGRCESVLCSGFPAPTATTPHAVPSHLRPLFDDESALGHAHDERGVRRRSLRGRRSTPATSASNTFPLRRTEWPPAPSGSQ